MTATKKETPKAKASTATKASNCMCQADLVAQCAATLMSRGGLPVNSAIETAQYIVEQAHERT